MTKSVKLSCIQLCIIPKGLTAFVGVCFCSLSLLMLCNAAAYGAEEGDEFPGHRTGGGTHWGVTLGPVAD
ncbi:MAG: hypothetical protein ACFB0C_22795 [Leptolyngbyaceae cyanobacterium]